MTTSPKTGKRMTRYELVRIIASRVEQITTGSPYTIKPEDDDGPIDIAIKELEAGRLPLMLERTMPDGSKENLYLKDMILPQRTLQHLRCISILPPRMEGLSQK